MRFHTPLCDLLGIKLPILQSGMGGVGGPKLAAAVSNAGGLGILGGHGRSPEELREAIEETRSRTARPFGVNLLLPEELMRLAPLDHLRHAERVQSTLNPMRAAVGVPSQQGIPPTPAQDLATKLEIVLAVEIPVFSIGLGNPGKELVARFHERKTKVIAMASHREDAVALEEAGVDAIVAQGGEAGGHRSSFKKPNQAATSLVGTMVLVPDVVDSVKVPVIAAGGIVDGRGLVAAMALGAQAAMIGTRFVATRESDAVEAYKKALLAASSGDTTVTDVASGRYARVIENAFTRKYGDNPVLPFGWQGSAVSDLFQGARDAGNADYQGLWAGQATGRIHDLPPAAEVVARIVHEAKEVLDRLQ
jgi:nitronate monooxygenase